MKPRKAAYLAHRWLGLVISIQLLAWSLGGLIFSVLDIKDVRGESGASALPPPRLSVPGGIALSPEAAPAIHGAHEFAFRDNGLGPRWIVQDWHRNAVAAIDPDTGAVLPRITRDQAAMLARRDRAAATISTAAELIEREAPREYRGRPLPAWRVDLDGDERITVYIHAVSGEVTARRNTMWRIFDFFWMLHIMDYRGRENFNHWLLTGASALAVLSAASGLMLWGWRISSRSREGVTLASSRPD